MMISQSRGKMYVSHERGVTQERDAYRSYHTFNFGSYFHENKEAIGSLLFLNDDTLNVEAHTKTLIKQGTSLLLLPVVGGLEYKGEISGETSGETSGFAEAGQACLLKPDKDTAIEISNPYATGLVNFLQIGIHVSSDQIHGSVSEFDLESHPDRLHSLLFSGEGNEKYVLGSIGRFGGRASGSYPVENPAAGVFAFVIDGVLEVQDRLLQSRDGMALWDAQEVEFEALSQEAILLLLEMHSKPAPR